MAFLGLGKKKRRRKSKESRGIGTGNLIALVSIGVFVGGGICYFFKKDKGANIENAIKKAARMRAYPATIPTDFNPGWNGVNHVRDRNENELINVGPMVKLSAPTPMNYSRIKFIGSFDSNVPEERTTYGNGMNALVSGRNDTISYMPPGRVDSHSDMYMRLGGGNFGTKHYFSDPDMVLDALSYFK